MTQACERQAFLGSPWLRHDAYSKTHPGGNILLKTRQGRCIRPAAYLSEARLLFWHHLSHIHFSESHQESKAQLLRFLYSTHYTDELKHV
jgi:hypothetical protein